MSKGFKNTNFNEQREPVTGDNVHVKMMLKQFAQTFSDN